MRKAGSVRPITSRCLTRWKTSIHEKAGSSSANRIFPLASPMRCVAPSSRGRERWYCSHPTCGTAPSPSAPRNRAPPSPSMPSLRRKSEIRSQKSEDTFSFPISDFRILTSASAVPFLFGFEQHGDEFALGFREERIPHVDHHDHAELVAVVPGFVLDGVIEQ